MSDQTKNEPVRDLTVRQDRDQFLTRYEPKNFIELRRLAGDVVKSGLAPDSVRKAEDAMIILMSGAELGLTAMQSLRSIHVIKGRPNLSADLMVALVRRSSICEYFKLVELTNTRCVYQTKRVDGDEINYEFTWEDAKRARLTNRDIWKKYPKNMLRARCASSLARAEYPELLTGVYDPDELAEVNHSQRSEKSKAEVVASPPPADDVVDAEFEPADIKEPVDHSDDEEWQNQSRRLHALISECGLNGEASRRVREYLKEHRQAESYKHLPTAFLRKVADKFGTLSPHETEDGAMPPRMSHIIDAVGMTPQEAAADSSTSDKDIDEIDDPDHSPHDEVIGLIDDAGAGDYADEYLAHLALVCGQDEFRQIEPKWVKTFAKTLRNYDDQERLHYIERAVKRDQGAQ